MAGVFDIALNTGGVPINETIALMCSSTRCLRLADRTALYVQGEPAATLFFILDGFVKTSRICEEGTEITIELLKHGDIAGAIPTRQQLSEHEETARAIGDVVVQRVPAHELRAAMEINPSLAVFVTEYLMRSKRSADRRVLRALTQSVDRRVIETLVELAVSFGARCPHGFSLEIRLTQQDIADLVGASRPVVSSVLSGLRKRGLLNYTRDMICVNDSALTLFARTLDTGA